MSRQCTPQRTPQTAADQESIDRVASILALGVIRWHRRRRAQVRDEIPVPKLGPETCHLPSDRDPLRVRKPRT